MPCAPRATGFGLYAYLELDGRKALAVGQFSELYGPCWREQVAAALSAATGKTVEYVQLPHDTLKASFLESGRAPWQVAGMFDSIRAIDAGAYGYDHSDFKTLTGKEPKTLVEWADSVKAGFQ